MQENTKDIQSPIAFKRTYSLVQKEPKVPSEGEPLPSVDDLPILNQQEADKVFYVTFLKDCGDNNICESQLHVEASLLLPTTGKSNSDFYLPFCQQTIDIVNTKYTIIIKLDVNVTVENPKK